LSNPFFKKIKKSSKHIFAADDVMGFPHLADYEAQIVIQNAFVPFLLKKTNEDSPLFADGGLQSLAHNGAGLGTVIGEKAARQLAEEAGFSGFERLLVEHPFIQVCALRK
jgi:hypothetical protein